MRVCPAAVQACKADTMRFFNKNLPAIRGMRPKHRGDETWKSLASTASRVSRLRTKPLAHSLLSHRPLVGSDVLKALVCRYQVKGLLFYRLLCYAPFLEDTFDNVARGRDLEAELEGCEMKLVSSSLESPALNWACLAWTNALCTAHPWVKRFWGNFFADRRFPNRRGNCRKLDSGSHVAMTMLHPSLLTFGFVIHVADFT